MLSPLCRRFNALDRERLAGGVASFVSNLLVPVTTLTGADRLAITDGFVASLSEAAQALCVPQIPCAHNTLLRPS